MKYCLLFLLLISVQCFSQSTEENIDLIINGVPVLKQPKSEDCWATVTTMLLCWKDSSNTQSSYSKRETKKLIKKTMKDLGSPWYEFYKGNRGLPYDKKSVLLAKVGLKDEPPANHLLEYYIDKLNEHGPLWITTSSAPNGLSSHAKLLIGIVGDYSYEKTDMVFIDPLKGKVIRQRAIDFVKEFENEAIYIVQSLKDNNIDFRIQVIHW